ncbi:MAG: serine/threonine protein kinase [Myxococcales bacterium]|nr:serine/threonine protein kinase [Myxococcales bacterium]
MRDLVDELLQAKVKATLFGGDHAPRLGRLVILDRIGSGAMGTVFAAYDPQLDRKVAVKLVRTGGVESTARVAREARALARLAHPNVVGIHDVGELDDEIYLVMELAPGIPLRTWIAGDRHWRDVARVMREAALGLAAAHRAQLIHRDVKPDNVLVGDDRTRVVDFGLAHDRADGDDGQSAGTPSYMAPEVLDGQPASEASDQFSLGVTLYEALYGVRPHGGSTREELRVTARAAASARPGRSTPSLSPADTVDVVGETEAIGASPTPAKVSVRGSDSAIQTEPTGRAVRSAPPAWLHAIVARMLAADPQKRFGSLDAVATALGRDRRRRAGVVALVVTASLASAAIGVIAYRHQTAHDPCDGGPARQQAVWSAEVATRVKTSLGTAPWTAKAVEGLDATASQWVTSYRHVCEASRVRGDQSDTLLDLRMRCLDRSLARFDALTIALAAPLDAPSRVEATGAVAELPPPLACETLDDPAELALPTDPAKRARVTAAERTLDRAWAAYALGHYAAAGEALRELRETVDLGAPALTAAVLLLAASVEARVGTPAAARTLLESALTAAAGAHTVELEASVWARLLRHELFAGSPANVIAWAPFAHAAAVRAGHEGAEIDGIVGEALRDAGQLDAARQHLARALASKDLLRGDQRALLEMNAGSVELAAGAPGAAEQAFTRALTLARDTLGDAHPTLAIYLDKLAAANRARGRIVAALALHDQSLAVRTAAYGETDRAVATSLLQRARTLIEADRLDDAAHDAAAALEIRAAKLGAQSPRLGEILAVQGEIAAARGERDAADLLYRRAAELDPRLDLRARRAAVGGFAADLPDTIDPLTVDRGAALAVRLGRLTHDEARPLATALRARILAIGPPVDPALALPVGEALYLLNDIPGAMAIARAVLGQLAPEPSRSRQRAQRLLDAAQQ